MENKAKNLIIGTLREVSVTKQVVFDNTIKTFDILKKVLKMIVKEYNQELKDVDSRVQLMYRDRGAFEAEVKIAGDLIVFNMHTNIFQFDRDHSVWEDTYVSEQELNSFSGIISVYNFLSDSFKYERYDDIGYMIARLFVNREMHYFVEGKRQLGFLYQDFAKSDIDEKSVRKIVESAFLYSLGFDLLVPPYDKVTLVSVAQMKDRINKSKIQTGKRLGFKFNADNDRT